MKLDIVQENEESRGTFYALGTNKAVCGLMTYIWSDSTTMLIDYSSVSAGFEGEGVEKHLVEAAAEFAREHHIKIVPLSAFARLQFNTDKKLQDVVDKLYL